MSRKYKFHNPDGVYFVMFAVDYAGGKGLLDIFVIEWKSEVLKGTDYEPLAHKSAPLSYKSTPTVFHSRKI